MADFPTITVITPTHNIVNSELTDEFNLLVTLLNMQTYPQVEHIVIDKASNDGTIQLLSDYKSKGYLQFYTEPDSGKFEALNKGIMRAKGKYVTFLSCDDFIHDITALDEIVGLLETNEADYTFAPSYSIHPEGFVIPFIPSMYNAFQGMPCSRQAMVFKKSVLSAEGYFDEKFKYMADFDLIIRLMLKDYAGIYYDKNYVTCRMSSNPFNDPDRVNNECRQIFIKNFRNLYPLTNEIVDKMLTYSEFPPQLLDKLSEHFAPENKADFLAACSEMNRLRIEAMNSTENQTGEEDSASPSANQ